MPTPNQMILPKTTDPDEFEKMCRDVLNEMYFREPRLKFDKYGRKGQKQHGIDLLAYYEEEDKHVIAQCKNYVNENSAQSLIKKVKNDIDAVRKSAFKVKELIIMTSMDRDARVQDEFARIPITTLMFWDNISEVICNTPKIYLTYYPIEYIEGRDEIQLLDEISNLLFDIGDKAFKFSKSPYKDINLYGDHVDRIYKECMNMHADSDRLNKITNSWSMHLESIGAFESLKAVFYSLPVNFDECEDNEDINKFQVVGSYLDHFNDKEKYETFKKHSSTARDAIRKQHGLLINKKIFDELSEKEKRKLFKDFFKD